MFLISIDSAIGEADSIRSAMITFDFRQSISEYQFERHLALGRFEIGLAPPLLRFGQMSFMVDQLKGSEFCRRDVFPLVMVKKPDCGNIKLVQ
jgi:hypothetical protein